MTTYETASKKLFSKKYKESIKLYEQILEKHPSHKDSLFYMGLAHDGIGEHAKAEKFFIKAQEKSASDLRYVIKQSNKKK